MAKYWYNVSSSKTILNNLKKDYNNLVDIANNVGKTMKKYVCVDGAWFDRNAVVTAKWWNQSGENKSGGALKWMEDKLVIQAASGSTNKNDGEDRIQKIVGGVAGVYYEFVAWSREGLKKSFDNLDDFVFAMGPHKGINATSCIDQLRLNANRLDLESRGYNVWKSKKITVTSTDGKVSDTEKMKQFIKELSDELAGLKKAWETMSKRMEKVLNNNDKSMWWGFDNKTKKNLQSLINSASKSIDEWIESFSTSICTALKTSENAVGLDLSALESLK